MKLLPKDVTNPLVPILGIITRLKAKTRTSAMASWTILLVRINSCSARKPGSFAALMMSALVYLEREKPFR